MALPEEEEEARRESRRFIEEKGSHASFWERGGMARNSHQDIERALLPPSLPPSLPPPLSPRHCF